MSRTAHVERTVENRNAYGVFMGKSEEKRLLETLIILLEDNINLDLQEMQCDNWCGMYASGSEYEQVAVCCKHVKMNFLIDGPSIL
jgi:hypothetical protein